ncbi:MAG TPA: DUF2934 domain-containing protein [Blastocatellia bacterium]|nr:DUF2934 domain-containing protein [Blastocatellia bacterium]
MAKTAISKSEPTAAAGNADLPVETTRTEPTEEEIAVRAYHIYLERGGAEGDPQNDWLRAERELSERQE